MYFVASLFLVAGKQKGHVMTSLNNLPYEYIYGVVPKFSGALGLSIKGAKILIISVCPFCAAQLIGVRPFSFGALGLSVKETKILAISVCPITAAQ